MKKSDALLLKMFLYALPLVALIGACGLLCGPALMEASRPIVRFLNALAGLIVALWMALTLFLSVRLILSGPLRDQVMSRLLFMRERDEREALLTGKATRIVFLTSIATLLFLLCLSCFRVSVYRLPAEKAINGRTGVVTLGLAFDLLQQPAPVKAAGQAVRNRDIFTYSGLPLSTPAVVLLFLALQVLSYNCAMRRLLREA
jgi:hypothetical protein